MALKMLFSLALGCLLTGAAAPAGRILDIRELGAVPGGKVVCSKMIQRAIDRCAAAGGGTVYFPPGTWLSGTIYLKSHVTLYLESGCTLLGSGDPKVYPENQPRVRSYTDTYVCQSLIAGEDLENVAIRGGGMIDGNGRKFPGKQYRNRPYVIRLVGCRDVVVEDVHLCNSPMWMQHYLACERVVLRGLRVFNHGGVNNDGMDVDGCRDVSVSGCTIDSDDDGLCLKSTLDRPCENVTVDNCTLRSHCAALKMGTESNGGFKNVAVSNCTISPSRCAEVVDGARGGLSGIALEIVDGGQLDRVTISNIVIDGIGTPLFLRLGNRARPVHKDSPKPGAGVFRNVMLSNIVATGASKLGSVIAGIPGHRIENVTLSNVRLEFAGGGGQRDAARKIEEKEAAYPTDTMFGVLPAYGLYCRHVKGLRLNNVQLATMRPDARPAMVFDDADDVFVDGRKPVPPSARPRGRDE